MKYMLLFYAAESAMSQFTAAQSQELYQEWQTLMQDATAAGVLLSSGGLAPTSNATTLRVREGKTLTTDGPFAETHEQLGGYFLVECKDLDEAMAWAAKIPHAKYGAVEIRPWWTNS